MRLAMMMIALVATAVATNFDARTKWGCSFTVLNQGGCGSCWDFCSVEAFSDRLCITGEAPKDVVVSPEPILECNSKGAGCQGSTPSTAWGYLIDYGSTTCTNACTSGCAPYDAAHNTVPKCHQGKCDSGSNWPVKYQAGSFKGLPKGAISTYQSELQNNGPLQMCFTVYDNFQPFFKNNPTGIYTSYSGNVDGGHCVKLVGWGTSGTTDYWTLQNSWGTGFANGGFFKMLRGTNLCGIEQQVSVGYTKKQSLALGIPEGVTNFTDFIVGGWYDHSDNLAQERFFLVAKFALDEISKKEGKELVLEKIVGAQTQVVAGTNFKLRLETKAGWTLEVTVYRTLEWSFELMDYEILV